MATSDDEPMLETPTFFPLRSATTLISGATSEVELPYYEMGFGGIQPEDTVVVTPQGGRILTTLPRDFKILG